MKVRADEEGVHVGPSVSGSFDVLFDDVPVWSFTVKSTRRVDSRLVAWPQAMRPWLRGQAEISLRPSVPTDDAATPVSLGLVRFGDSAEPLRFVDRAGRPVVVDKWGIVQRTFESRGETVAAEAAELAQRVIDIVREECGLEAWIAFGTLLGAARAGKAIGHDSDVDLLYLSEHESPSRINLEAYRIKRALTRRGLSAVAKNGSFVTVVCEGADGAPLGIDIYACFYVGELLHESATVRAPVPRDAILPLSTMTFEGRELPAPARPDTLLQASYGPNWRVPDPSFRHTPGPEIIRRFDSWFGNLMSHRRAWELWWREHQEPAAEPSALAARLLADQTWPTRIVELGAGNGSDALAMAGQGHRVLATDYARPAFKAARARARDLGLRMRFRLVNLYDFRDTVSAAAQLQAGRRPRVVLARGVLDSIQPRAVDHVWRFCAMALRGGGRAYLEYDAPTSGAPGSSYSGEDELPRYVLRPEQVAARAERFGGRVAAHEQVATIPAGSGGAPARTRWQLVVEWP